MATITTATLIARLYADTSAFVAGMNAAAQTAVLSGDRIKAVGTQVTNAGKAWVKAFAPIALIGGLAMKAAMDYNSAIGKIRRLTTMTTNDVAMMKDEILKISLETGKTPKELADAMFMLASSGLSARNAVDALRMASQAAAIGLGDTMVIGDAVASAMNAYGQKSLTARDATNALINAIKVGKMPPEELAGVLGRVTSMAAGLGISFQEVTADIASLTQVGVPAAIAGTALRSTMMSLMKPTDDARAKFAMLVEGGIDAVRIAVRDKGLLPTLQDLADRVHGNTTEITALFPEARALVGVLAWTGQNAGNSARNFAELEKNTDSLAKGMEDLAASPGYRMKQALASIQVALIKLGDTITPFVAELAKGFSRVFGAIASLPKPVLVVMGVFSTWGVVVGILMGTLGKLITLVGSATNALLNMATAPMTLASGIQIAMMALGALVMAYIAVTRETRVNKDVVDALTESYRRQAGVIDEVAQTKLYDALKSKNQIDDLKRLDKALAYDESAWQMWLDAVNGSEVATRKLRRAMLATGELTLLDRNGLEANTEARREFIRYGTYQGRVLNETSDHYKGNTGLLAMLTSQTNEASLAQKALTDEVGAGVAQQSAFSGAITKAGEAINSVGLSVENLEAEMDAARATGDALRTTFDAIFGSAMTMVEAEIQARANVASLKEAFKDAGTTSDDHVSALLEAVRGYNELSAATVTQTGDAAGAHAQWQMNVGALIRTAAQAGATRDEFAQLARALNMPETVVTAMQTPGADAATILFENLGLIIEQIPKNPTVVAKADTTQAVGAIGALNSALDGYRRAWEAFWGTGQGALGPVGPQGAGLPRVPSGPNGAGGSIANTTINVNVSGTGQLVGQAVVDALVAWQRRNGTVPVVTRR